MDVSEHDRRIGSLVDGRYKILESMASGSMGVVYKAERVPVGKAVAVKFLHHAMASDPEFVGRFERETRVMSKLAHPHCVSVVDFGISEGAPYLVMDFVSGTTLRALVDDALIEPERALALIRQILAGLAHAHDQGIVHRDIKPANIMITEEIGTGQHVRILDFGLARLNAALGSNTTQANIVVGTPSYMAPEQTIDAKVDSRADLYAVGIVLFEMICGEKPFRSESTLDLLAMHRAAPVPRLAALVPPSVQVPAGLQEVLDRALAKEPEDRFQTAIEFAAAIDDVIGGMAPPPSRRPTSFPPPPLAPRPRDGSSTLLPKTRSGRLGWLMLLLLFVLAGTAFLVVRNTGDDDDTRASSAKRGATTAPPTKLADAASRAAAARPDASTVLGTVDAEALAAVPIDAGVPDAAPAVPIDAAPIEPLALDAAAPVVPLGAIDAAVLEEPEPDPTTAENPDPTTAEIAAGSEADEEEAPDQPAVVPEPELEVVPPKPEPEPLARNTKDAVKLIRAGKRELALRSLRALMKKQKKSAYIPFLIGNIYFDKRWWSVALDYYTTAIKRNKAYKKNGTLNRNVIRMLASKKSRNKASWFFRKTVGRAARPYLKKAARYDKNGTVRKMAVSILKRIR